MPLFCHSAASSSVCFWLRGSNIHRWTWTVFHHCQCWCIHHWRFAFFLWKKKPAIIISFVYNPSSKKSIPNVTEWMFHKHSPNGMWIIYFTVGFWYKSIHIYKHFSSIPATTFAISAIYPLKNWAFSAICFFLRLKGVVLNIIKPLKMLFYIFKNFLAFILVWLFYLLGANFSFFGFKFADLIFFLLFPLHSDIFC